MSFLSEMPRFFLGANAPKGYYSKFDQLFNYKPGSKCFLLKGGPGTGKSTVLKKTAEELHKKGLSTELIYCSADTDSLDAIVTSDGSFSVLDATLPHSVEPKYPGAYEKTIDLGDCWNTSELEKNADKIVALFNKNRELHDRARRYISAAASLFDEVARLSLAEISQDKVVKAALRICARELHKTSMRCGKEKIRFLSAVTGDGVILFDDTVKLLCGKIYVVDDDCGAVSRIFMNTVRKAALERGYDIITCRCSVFPQEKNEHILIPEAGIGFLTSNRRHTVNTKPYRMIHAKRFADKEKGGRTKFRIKFTLKAATELTREASICMREAKTIHDELEKIYMGAMDFSLVDEKQKKILEAVSKL